MCVCVLVHTNSDTEERPVQGPCYNYGFVGIVYVESHCTEYGTV